GRLAASTEGGSPGRRATRAASPGTTSSRCAASGARAATVRGSSAASTGATPPAITRRAAPPRPRGSEPTPRPPPRATAARPTPPSATMRLTVPGSTTKFCPSHFAGLTPSRRAISRVSAGPSRASVVTGLVSPGAEHALAGRGELPAQRLDRDLLDVGERAHGIGHHRGRVRLSPVWDGGEERRVGLHQQQVGGRGPRRLPQPARLAG